MKPKRLPKQVKASGGEGFISLPTPPDHNPNMYRTWTEQMFLNAGFTVVDGAWVKAPLDADARYAEFLAAVRKMEEDNERIYPRD